MARNKPAGLLDIGVEGFRILEDSYGYGRNTKQTPRQERQSQHGNGPQPPYVTNRRNSNYNSVPPTKEGVIDCNEAVKLYGGVLFKETGRKKRSFFGFGFSKAW